MSGRVFSTWYQARYFSPAEFACKCGCGLGMVAPMSGSLLIALDKIREKIGLPLVVNSGWRCELHNKCVGGAESSRHLIGCAADIALRSENIRAFRAAAHEWGLKIIEYPHKGFVHVEIE